jgi:hypothetical protein
MNTHASHAASASPSSASAPFSNAAVRRIVSSSSVGNALEWFDFLVYGYFANFIAKQLFATQDRWRSMLLAIGIVARSTVGLYVLQLYMPMYEVKQLHMPAAASFGVVVLNGGLQIRLLPMMGRCEIASDASASC